MNKNIRDPKNWLKDELALLWGIVLIASVLTAASAFAPLSGFILVLGAFRTKQLVSTAKLALTAL